MIIKNLQSMAPPAESKDIDINKLTDLINQGYETYNSSSFKKKKSFSPSTLVYGNGACPRYWFIAFNGAIFVDKFDPVSIGNMKSGTDAHERLGDLLNRSGLQIKYLELELESDDPPIRCFIDVGVDRAGEEVIGEIKTTRSEVFHARQSKGQPADYHIMQLLIYMKLRGVRAGFILLENRNDFSLLIFPVYMGESEQEWVDEAFDWMRTVHKAYKENKLPKKPYRKNAKECKSCPVKDACDDMDEGVIDIAPMKQYQFGE